MLIFLNVDSTTRRLNKVLIDSGFAPEWISLEKEIRQDIELFREGLLFRRMKLGPSPLALQATVQWNHDVKEFEQKMRLINKKIDKFKQKVHFNFEKEVNKTVESFGYGSSAEESEVELDSSATENNKVRSSASVTFIKKVMEIFIETFSKVPVHKSRT